MEGEFDIKETSEVERDNEERVLVTQRDWALHRETL